MYATEPCVKFRCLRCDAWITAAQTASKLVCPECKAYQDASYERMQHFSINHHEVLLGRDEWLDAPQAEARLDQERQKIHQTIERWRLHSDERNARIQALDGQMEAIDAAIKLCRRQAAQ
jgi:hypothetical protein